MSSLVTLAKSLNVFSMPLLFKKACDIGKVNPPQTSAEAEALSAKCLSAAKTKAELFSKFSGLNLKHSNNLDVVAKLCQFDNWFDMNNSLKRFAEDKYGEKSIKSGAYRAVIATWVLDGERKSDEIVEWISKYKIAVLMDEFRFDGETSVSLLKSIFHKVNKPTSGKKSFSVSDVEQCINNYLGWDSPGMLMKLLERDPVVDGVRVKLKSIKSITVKEALLMPWANSYAAGFGATGLEHIVADVIKRLGEEPNPRFVDEMIMGEIDPSEIRNNQKLYKDNIERMKWSKETTENVMTVVIDKMARTFNNTMYEVFMRKPAANGFFAERNEFYGLNETAESYFDNFSKYFHIVGKAKKLAFKKPIEGGLLSVFRRKIFSDHNSEVSEVYEVESLLHDENEKLIGCASFALRYSDDSSVHSIVSDFDETDNNDLMEAGFGIVDAACRFDVIESQLKSIMVVRGIEIIKEKRGFGIGTNMFKESVYLATKGIKECNVLVAKPYPTDMTIEPSFDWIVRTSYSEIADKIYRIGDYWRNYYDDDYNFVVGKRKFQNFIRVEPNEACHSHGLRLMLLGLLYSGKYEDMKIREFNASGLSLE